MGKYSSDEDRKKSRRNRYERRRRSSSRSRSRSRSRSSGRRREERRRRSRSRDNRRNRSRDRHNRSSRDGISKHRRQHRSSSKSRRGRHRHSRSRSRSQKRRSRSSSYHRKRRNGNRSMSSSSESRSRSSSYHKSSGKEGVKKDSVGTQDLSTYIPSADVLAKIDSAGFVPETFVSQSSNIGENSDSVPLNSHEKSHDDAIFGTSNSRVSHSTTNVKYNNIQTHSSGKESGVMATLLHEQEHVKNDRWMKKLQSMREKKLSST